MAGAMRLIVNENIAKTVCRALRDQGHDVFAVKELMAGADDATILAVARSELRVVLTQDKDFGELAFRCGLPAECGVILFRLRGTNPDSDGRRMLEVIESRQDWAGQFAVATDDRVRIRALRTYKPAS
jgi:predicted nuclease of predicted toxin-antitoxin system